MLNKQKRTLDNIAFMPSTYYYSAIDLENLPTIESGQLGELKVITYSYRIWYMSPRKNKTKFPCDKLVTVQILGYFSRWIERYHYEAI